MNIVVNRHFSTFASQEVGRVEDMQSWPPPYRDWRRNLSHTVTRPKSSSPIPNGNSTRFLCEKNIQLYRYYRPPG